MTALQAKKVAWLRRKAPGIVIVDESSSDGFDDQAVVVKAYDGFLGLVLLIGHNGEIEGTAPYGDGPPASVVADKPEPETAGGLFG